MIIEGTYVLGYRLMWHLALTWHLSAITYLIKQVRFGDGPLYPNNSCVKLGLFLGGVKTLKEWEDSCSN
jgi:hypothetical protein